MTEEKPQIGDNFILKRRDWYMMEAKDCFGHYSSCANRSECPSRMECLKKRIERIRKGILGKGLDLEFQTLAFGMPVRLRR